ncbi:MAG: HEAT repeat domain-containing protein [Phycisphaerales bacterium JB064]
MTLAGLIGIVIVVFGLALVVLGLLLFRGRKPKDGASRTRRPIWLVIALAGVLVMLEPVTLGTERIVYDVLPNSTIAHLHARWSDPHARDIVNRHIGVVVAQDNDFHNIHLGLLAEGAIARIELANARHPGDLDRIDDLDLLILRHHDDSTPPPHFTARVAAAMPPLFGVSRRGLRRDVAWLAFDRHDFASTLPAVLAATEDPDANVRMTAARCLWWHVLMGQDAAVGPFVTMLDDDNEAVKTEAAQVLLDRALRQPVPASMAMPLGTLRPRGELVRRARIMGLLAAMGSLPESEAFLHAADRLLREGDDPVRWDALTLIGNVPELARALRLDTDATDGEPLAEWIAHQRGRPVDSVLEELGFE